MDRYAIDAMTASHSNHQRLDNRTDIPSASSSSSSSRASSSSNSTGSSPIDSPSSSPCRGTPVTSISLSVSSASSGGGKRYCCACRRVGTGIAAIWRYRQNRGVARVPDAGVWDGRRENKRPKRAGMARGTSVCVRHALVPDPQTPSAPLCANGFCMPSDRSHAVEGGQGRIGSWWFLLRGRRSSQCHLTHHHSIPINHVLDPKLTWLSKRTSAVESNRSEAPTRTSLPPPLFFLSFLVTSSLIVSKESVCRRLEGRCCATRNVLLTEHIPCALHATLNAGSVSLFI